MKDEQPTNEYEIKVYSLPPLEIEDSHLLPTYENLEMERILNPFQTAKKRAENSADVESRSAALENYTKENCRS